MLRRSSARQAPSVLGQFEIYSLVQCRVEHAFRRAYGKPNPTCALAPEVNLPVTSAAEADTFSGPRLHALRRAPLNIARTQFQTHPIIINWIICRFLTQAYNARCDREEHRWPWDSTLSAPNVTPIEPCWKPASAFPAIAAPELRQTAATATGMSCAVPVRLIVCVRCHYLELYHDVGLGKLS